MLWLQWFWGMNDCSPTCWVYILLYEVKAQSFFVEPCHLCVGCAWRWAGVCDVSGVWLYLHAFRTPLPTLSTVWQISENNVTDCLGLGLTLSAALQKPLTYVSSQQTRFKVMLYRSTWKDRSLVKFSLCHVVYNIPVTCQLLLQWFSYWYTLPKHSNSVFLALAHLDMILLVLLIIVPLNFTLFPMTFCPLCLWSFFYSIFCSYSPHASLACNRLEFQRGYWLSKSPNIWN